MEFDKTSHYIIGAALKVHSALGPGLFEQTYKLCLGHLLEKEGMKVILEYPIPIHFEGISIGESYRSDLFVDDSVIVELKAVEALMPIHETQLLTYLKLSRVKIGLLINFNVLSLKHGIRRIVN